MKYLQVGGSASPLFFSVSKSLSLFTVSSLPKTKPNQKKKKTCSVSSPPNPSKPPLREHQPLPPLSSSSTHYLIKIAVLSLIFPRNSAQTN
jgi:hypothetical protein